MFQTFRKNYQSQNQANTWQHALKKREIAKNNYRATGDIKQANAFVKMITNFSFHTPHEITSEHIIFSNETLAVPLVPEYVFHL